MARAMTCEGRVALVTGAAGKGMGRSIALTLAREGAKVIVNYRASEESARAIADHIEDRGGSAITVKADVFEAEGCEKLVDAAIERFGQVDICIIGPGGGWHPEPPHELDAAAALADARQELAPIYHLLALALPGMYEREWGRLVALGLGPPYDSPAYAYNVGKAARAHAFMLAWAKAWQHGVTMNTIGPGPVPEIASLAEAIELCDHGPAWQNRANITGQDIAEGVAFLCSEAGRFITGCVLPFAYHG